jgi:hypothetical protein
MAQPYIHHPIPPKHPYQDQYIDAIITGNLKAFKELRVPVRDISRQLFLPATVNPRPRYHPRGHPVVVRRPTLLQFAVICEQDEIVRYILDYKEPDLSAKSGDGRNVLHIAAAVKDYRPLQILLEYEWIQEHIDERLDLPGQERRDGCFNTALHIAVTNQNVRHVLLLIQSLPPLHVSPRAAKSLDPDEVADRPPHNPVNYDQRSAAGSLPLHIAVHQQNLAIVRILLAAGADPSLTNDEGQQPLDFARALKAVRDEELAKRRKRLEDAGKPYTPPEAKSDIDEIVKCLEAPPDDAIEQLQQEFAPELTPKVAVAPTGDAGDDEDPAEGKGGRASAKLEELSRLMRDFDRRLRAIESGRVAPRIDTAAAIVTGSECSVCRAPGEPCGQCHVPFCDVCKPKLPHQCPA